MMQLVHSIIIMKGFRMILVICFQLCPRFNNPLWRFCAVPCSLGYHAHGGLGGAACVPALLSPGPMTTPSASPSKPSPPAASVQQWGTPHPWVCAFALPCVAANEGGKLVA